MIAEQAESTSGSSGFGIEHERRQVLAAWAGSAQRFREDANSEEDLALGGYRDRVIVELAQNAADAAARAAIPGRLLLRLTGEGVGGPHGTLIAANTGTPLDRAGVRALASLRASAKRDGDTVGRFGVGFSAVLAVTGNPAVRSITGGVRFSDAGTRELVRELAAGAPELAAELDQRGGHVPILRLPFDDPEPPPPGYDTAVVLPLRDDAARNLVIRQLADAGDPLLLALPGLNEIEIVVPGERERILRDADQRWHVLRRNGQLAPGTTAERPVEDRNRTGWQITWAVRRDGEAPQVAPVVHAPTPSDEPQTLPALLIATFPLDPSRRHVASGAITTELIEHAAQAYAALIAELAQGQAQDFAQAAAGGGRAGVTEAWRLVPTGLPSGAIDGALRSEIAQLLTSTPMLAAADEPQLLLRPRDALAMTPPLGADEAAVAELATWMAGLVQAPRAADAAFATLRIRRLDLAEVIEQLPQTSDPDRWRRLYVVLEPYAADPRGREALSAIGVPLADGRVARGARGLLLGTDGVPAQALASLGVKVVHPDAAHALLERLGATPAGPRAVLELPAVRSAVLAQADDDDVEGDVTESVLALVAAAVDGGELAAGDLPWLGELELDDADGEPAPAVTLALPGSPAAGWFDPQDVGLVDLALAGRWGAAVLTAVGVLSGPGLWQARDVSLDDDESDDGPDSAGAVLEGWPDWCEQALDQLDDPLGAVIPELIAVRDLDLVLPGRLPEVVAAIAADPVLRRALVTPVRVLSGGAAADVTGPTAWWLRRELTGGVTAGPGAEPGLAALLPSAPVWVSGLDAEVRRALGVVTELDDLDAAALPAVLDRLADPVLVVAPGVLLDVLRHLAGLAQRGVTTADPPEYVRAWSPSGTQVVAAADACVVDAPMYRQRPDLGAPLLVAPELAHSLADLLDLPLARELGGGIVSENGSRAGVVQPVDAGAAELLGAAVTQWCEHEDLVVDGVEVDWWVDDAGLPHAATTDGLARALASAAGRWGLRHALAAVLLAGPSEQAGLISDALADEVFPQ